MISSEHVGRRIRYWTRGVKGSGEHTGILNQIDKNTAVIKNAIPRKRDIRVPLGDCEPILGEIVMTIFEELFEAAEKSAQFKKQGPEHSDQFYMQTLLLVIQKLPDNEWIKLSAAAQRWYNGAANQYKENRTIPSCPGFTGLGTVIENVPTKEANIIKVPESGRVQSSTPNVANAPKAKRQTTGIMDALRKIVILHPDWTSRQIFDHLKVNGFPNAKLDTISVDGGNIRRVIEIMKESGWKEPVTT